MDFKEIAVNMRNWVDSAQDRDYWRAVVNMTLNLRVHKPWSSRMHLSQSTGLAITTDQGTNLSYLYLYLDRREAGSRLTSPISQ